ncbi:hypothetical protein NQZ68_032177 [Dissostichus eleginoides]|nr:hypothetical protein NQZ68_032177 [Dissostichus eleginoides]
MPDFSADRSVRSSEHACLPPAKVIIYITALQWKHNDYFLWKTKRQVSEKIEGESQGRNTTRVNVLCIS